MCQGLMRWLEAIVAKASRMGILVSELMRRGALVFLAPKREAELVVLADAAQLAAERAGAAIEDAMAFVASSNERIQAMELSAAKKPKSR